MSGAWLSILAVGVLLGAGPAAGRVAQDERTSNEDRTPFEKRAAASATDAAEPGEAGARPRLQEELRHTLSRLEYLIGDYPEAVDEQGRVFHEGEHEEHVEMLEEIEAVLERTPGAARRGILRELHALQRAVLGHEPPRSVILRLRRLHGRIVREYRVRLVPEQVPSLAAGRILFAEACAICHAEDGSGDTPRGRELTPAPRDFRAAEHEEWLSPAAAFGVITYGVKETAMASYGTLSEEERWSLAFYVLALRHPETPPPAAADGAAAASGPQTLLPDLSVRDLATSSDADLRRRLVHWPAAARDAQISRWRRTLPLRVE